MLLQVICKQTKKNESFNGISWAAVKQVRPKSRKEKGGVSLSCRYKAGDRIMVFFVFKEGED